MIKLRTRILISVLIVSSVFFSIAMTITRRTFDGKKTIVAGSIKNVSSKNLVDMMEVIETYESRQMTTEGSPWKLFHGLLGRLNDYKILEANGVSRSCLNWLLKEVCGKGSYKGTPLLIKRQWGLTFTHGPHPDIKHEFEDHLCQFLFILMELGLSPEHTVIYASGEGGPGKLLEVVEASENFCHGQSDLCWALPVMAKWGRGSSWTNKFGSEFNLERLFVQHMKREKFCDACFGTHWRMGLAMGLEYGSEKISKRVRSSAKHLLREKILEARASQSDAGQFMLIWGVYPPKPAGANDLPTLPSSRSDLLSHQGHMLEWLMVALPDEILATEEWPHRGINRLIVELGNLEEDISYGVHCHCIHALRLYERRMQNLF